MSSYKQITQFFIIQQNALSDFVCGSESQSEQQCFFTNAIMVLLNGGEHRRAIRGLQIRVKCASLTIQVYLPYELPRQCFYHMRSIVS